MDFQPHPIIPPPLIEDHFCHSNKEHIRALMRDFFTEPQQAPQVPTVPPIVVVPRLVQFGVFMIEYSQPDPLPDHIKMLQRCNIQGFEMVRIPISLELNPLTASPLGAGDIYLHRHYLLPEFLALMHHAGINKEFVNNLIHEYQIGKNPKVATPLHAAYQLAKYHAEIHNYEFL